MTTNIPHADLNQIVYHVVAFEPEMVAAQWDDEMDPPFVDGLIALSADEKIDLEARLDRMFDNGLVGSYSVEMWEPETPRPLSVEGIYNLITGDIEHVEAETRDVWDGTNAAD